LEALKDNYVAGKTETLNSILCTLRALVELYPKHIYKEDVQFFYPSMKYFTQEEQERMLHEFTEFDRNFVPKKYKQIVALLGS